MALFMYLEISNVDKFETVSSHEECVATPDSSSGDRGSSSVCDVCDHFLLTAGQGNELMSLGCGGVRVEW